MIGWIIAGAIVLLVAFLLFRYAKVTVCIEKSIEITVKYWLFPLLRIPSPPKKKKKARSKKKKPEKKKEPSGEALKDDPGVKTAEDAADSDDDTEQEAAEEKTEEISGETPGDKPPKAKKSLPKIDLEMINDYLGAAKPPMKRLFRKIRFRDIYIDYVAGSDDAAATALKYGSASAFVNSLICILRTYFDTKVGEVNIEADFSAEKDDLFVYFTVKLRVSTAIGCALWAGIRLLKVYLKYNKKQKPDKRHKRKPNKNNKKAKAGK